MGARTERYPFLRDQDIFEQLLQQNCLSGVPTDSFNDVVRKRFPNIEDTFKSMDENHIRHRGTILKELSAIWKQKDEHIARQFSNSIKSEHKEFPFTDQQ